MYSLYRAVQYVFKDAFHAWERAFLAVILSAAKDLSLAEHRSFAALRMTGVLKFSPLELVPVIGYGASCLSRVTIPE
jgi:hypothetical protein